MKVSKTNKPRLFVLISLAFLALTTSGCVLPAPRQSSSTAPRDFPFIPPTLVPTALPTSAATRVVETPTPCLDSLSYLSDVTIPDGTIVAPAASVDKRWEVENSGTCNWTSRYRLKLVAGAEMGAKPEQSLLPARSGARVELRIQFTAPETPGTYRSAWQAFNPNGQPFGDAIYIEIVVE